MVFSDTYYLELHVGTTFDCKFKCLASKDVNVYSVQTTNLIFASKK